VHTREEDRALTGAWIMDEMRGAVEKGYWILEIYEVNEYQVTQYDPQNRRGWTICGVYKYVSET